MAIMFLRSTTRKKNGKEHEYFSIVENKRVAAGRVVQRHVLYLGEINSSQQEAWRKTVEIFEDGQAQPKTVALFPEERAVPIGREEDRTDPAQRPSGEAAPAMGGVLVGHRVV